MKLVKILYRASTMGQVEKDDDKFDIPAQKRACREFVKTKQDWMITDEVYETGVSGYKISAKHRSKILSLQRDAAAGKFDVLLVFMFDRLGRREDETPFLVEWFVNNGVEVWSVVEGQRKFEHHTDKLTNYITFWQAEGESIKTSIRTSNGMAEMVQQGRFKGGVPAYGYKLERCGRKNKRGREVLDIVIDEEEAAVVRMIFDRYVNAGLGTSAIANYLANRGIFNRLGDNFVCSTTANILKNPMYRGVLRSGDSFSEPFDHLRIIDDEMFDAAQRLIEQRKRGGSSQRRMPLMTNGACLLSGNIFCAHCGARLTATTGGRIYTRKDGTVVNNRKYRYNCYNRTRHRQKCNGNTGYDAKVIDQAVSTFVKEIFKGVKQVPVSDLLNEQYTQELSDRKKRLVKAQANAKKAADSLAALNEEVTRCIQGTSKFTPELLSMNIARVSNEQKELESIIKKLSFEYEDKEKDILMLQSQYDKLLNWATIFDRCEMPVKKMIVANLVECIKVTSIENIEIKLNITYKQYMKYVGHIDDCITVM